MPILSDQYKYGDIGESICHVILDYPRFLAAWSKMGGQLAKELVYFLFYVYQRFYVKTLSRTHSDKI